MSDIETIWNKTAEVFPILNKSLRCPTITNKDFEYVVVQLGQLAITDCVYESIMLEINAILRQQIVPSFWEYFLNPVEPDSKDQLHHWLDPSGALTATVKSEALRKNQYSLFSKFEAAVVRLESDYKNILELLQRVEMFKKMSTFENPEIKTRNDSDEFKEMLKSALLSQLPANFNHVVYAFYSVSFKVFSNSHEANTDDDDMGEIDEVKCNGCERDMEACNCQYLICAFNLTNEHLTNMGLLDRIAGFTLTTLIQKSISQYVRDKCQGIFDKCHMKDLEKWLDEIVLRWLTRIFNRGHLKINDSDTRTQSIIQEFKVKLTYFLYETYANIIIEQFFSIIIDYPDSIPAIDDLKLCMEKIDMRKHLVKTLKESLEARILHPGVNTMDILTGYVAAIKTIRHLDSSGIILETVTEPIKEYLRRRSDTVRRVVTGLTEEGPTDLAEELAKSETLKENAEAAGKDEMSNWENWQPDPVDSNPISVQTTRTNRSADIISMVVDIYGSKELFVNEYRNLLADRLLTLLDFNPEKEIRNLELLKLRFGETLLHSCEVMLKDISDSKRINTHIQSDINYMDEKTFDLSSLIISSQFWPAFNKETLELPEEIDNEFKKYTKSYEAYKGNRTLCWRHVTGRVNIEIELADRTLEMTVAPTQAVIIYHFQEKNEWSIDELSCLIKVPPSVLRRRIGFWQTNGLLKETQTDVYTLMDGSHQSSQVEDMQSTEINEEDESESAMASASDQREEELQVFWSYIVGMLTNLDSLPIERIHQMLKMFASHGPGIEFSQEELKNFLQRKVREHKLLFTGGVYQLAK